MSKYKANTEKYSVRIETAKLNILKEEFGEESITKIIDMLIDERINKVIPAPNRLRSPIIRMGGKSLIANQLVEMMPKHKVFVDVFGGAMHILFAKPQKLSKIEVVNDKYEEIINLFKVIKDRPLDLREELLKIPTSRAYYTQIKDNDNPEPLDRAVKFLYLLRNSKFGNIEAGFQPSLANNPAVTRKHIADSLPYISQRLKNVTLECSTWQYMLKTYGKEKDAFLFIDPPYLIENKKQGLYELPFDLRDTRELAKRLNELPCKVMVTHYEDKHYAKYFEGWRTERIDVYKSSGAVEQTETVDENGNAVIKTTKPKAVEVVYMNY